MSRYAEAYKNETIAFCKTLQEGGNPTPSGNDGKMALILAMAAGKSFVEKRPVKYVSCPPTHRPTCSSTSLPTSLPPHLPPYLSIYPPTQPPTYSLPTGSPRSSPKHVLG